MHIVTLPNDKFTEENYGHGLSMIEGGIHIDSNYFSDDLGI